MTISTKLRFGRSLWLGFMAVFCSLQAFALEETPQEALTDMSRMLQDGDFRGLIESRYSEIDKVQSAEQLEKLIERFEARFDGAKALDKALKSYEDALSQEPDYEIHDLAPDLETGEVVIFNTPQGTIKLYRMKAGHWGFHL